MNSIWLDHPNYPGYKFSPEGGVLSLISKKPFHFIKKRPDRNGYIICGIKKNGKPKTVMVHRILGEIFLKNDSGHSHWTEIQINHKNGIKSDNSLNNLEWISPKENLLHSRNHLGNLHCARGENHGFAKLSWEEVQYIKKEAAYGQRGIGNILAKKFNVSIGTISMIKNGKIWKERN